ncbi:MAG: transcriptional regulator [Blastocatellia bacterium]
MPTKAVGPGITRYDLDDHQMHGYRVRIRRQNQLHVKFFSDKKCGGKRKARELAEAYYRELLATLPVSKAGKGKITARNKSGKAGISLVKDTSKRWPSSTTWRYVAAWLDADGTRRKISFGVEKYGKTRAWEYACLARDSEVDDREELFMLYKKMKQKERKSAEPPAPPRAARKKRSAKDVRP